VQTARQNFFAKKKNESCGLLPRALSARAAFSSASQLSEENRNAEMLTLSGWIHRRRGNGGFITHVTRAGRRDLTNAAQRG
jgi:hypothetical protein